jgi:hypothetical protein
MSIPLINDVNKNDINTSIIAIKKNIERINMLLGLSNSEEIDTSKFATKEELQQAVTDLQPVDEVAVDNMQSVTSNAVAKMFEQGNIYGYTETRTVNGWANLVNLGALKGKYAIIVFNRGGLAYSIQSRNTSFASGSIPDNMTYLRVLDFPTDNEENIGVASFTGSSVSVTVDVVLIRMNN